jgi:hypothetical protein
VNVTVIADCLPARSAFDVTAAEIAVDAFVPALVYPVSALAGATVRTPKPNAATVTSAMRLKVVFVDICFLSISRSEEFPPVGFG